MKIEQLYDIYLEHSSVKTDTRHLQQGDLFFALKGPNFNGNTFAGKALEAGASFVIIDEAAYRQDERTILVDNALSTLQQLALFHRKQFNIPFLAITGSNGKTTTKELIHQVLSTSLKTYTTKGNLNNHIGIPLTILAVKKDAEIAVIEMGANHQKEIEAYCTYTLPTHGIITNAGKAHLEGFGGVEGVKKGKGELYDFIREHRGTVFVMWDYDYLRTMSSGMSSIIRYGILEGDVTGRIIESNPFLQVEITKGADTGIIRTRLVGEYNLPNVLAAVCVGKYFNVPDAQIKKACEAYNPSNSRSQLIEKDSNQIIMDAYNANPSSMRSAIENFAQLTSGQKVVMLGAMAELGSDSLEEHKELVRLIEKYSWKNVVLVGGDFAKVPHSYIYFNNALEAKEWYRQQHFTNTTVLVKGSRSMQMEEVLNRD